MKNDHHKNTKVSDAPRSEKLLEGEIPAEILQAAYDSVFKSAKNTVEVPGFRAGKAPEHMIKANINEAKLLDLAAEDVLKAEYPEMIEYHKLFPIDHPRIEITKLALGNPLGFRIHVPVMPKIEIPDYKKAAKKENAAKPEAVEATDEEINAAIENIRKMWAHREHKHAAGEVHDHKHEEETPLPEVNDEFVKQIGDFKDVADFKEKVKQSIFNEKVIRAKEKKRVAIIDAIVADFKIDLPKILVDGELDRMMAEFEANISQAGIGKKEYYAQIGKTEEAIRTEWTPEAEKRVKMEIALAEIAKKEGLKPDAELVGKESEHILSHHKDADKDRVRSYVEHMLTNEKVFEFLEKQS